MSDFEPHDDDAVVKAVDLMKCVLDGYEPDEFEPVHVEGLIRLVALLLDDYDDPIDTLNSVAYGRV